MLSTVDRRDYIVQLIRDRGKVHVKSLSTKFEVSGVTIRNDLEYLERIGILHRMRGGALLKNKISRINNSAEKGNRQFKKENSKIGLKAAELINTGNSVFFDSGITCFDITANISCYSNLLVMTNSVNIGIELIDKKVKKVIFTGGDLQLQNGSYAFAGVEAEASITNYYFDVLFIGPEALDIHYGLSTTYPLKARLNQAIIDRSRNVIAVIASKNLKRRSFAHICSVEVLNTLITDKKIDGETEDELTSKNINVVKV